MVCFRTFVGNFSEVASHLTLPNCKTQSKGSYSWSRMSNCISKSLFSHKQTALRVDTSLQYWTFLCVAGNYRNEWFCQLWTWSRKVRRFFHWNSGIVPHPLHTMAAVTLELKKRAKQTWPRSHYSWRSELNKQSVYIARTAVTWKLFSIRGPSYANTLCLFSSLL